MNGDDPNVSIVIDNWNYARFLPAAIESALGQTLQDVEVIVVDDGSTDDSRAILESYGTRITCVFQENGGQAAALNAGFARATGDVVLLLDSDDILYPETAALVAAAFGSDPSVALVQYRLAVVGPSDCVVGVRPPAHVAMPSGDLRRDSKRLDNHTGWSPTSGTAYRADLLRPALPIPEATYRICADEYLTRAAALSGRVRSLDMIGGIYRMHGANNFVTNRSYAESIQATLRRIREGHRYLGDLAGKLGIAGFPPVVTGMVNMTFLAYCMASMKLAPASHPIPNDSVARTMVRGSLAAWGRHDLSTILRLLHIGWFIGMFVAPRPLATKLVEMFFYPETRGGLNTWLARFKRKA